MKILLVDDDSDLVAVLTFALRRAGFSVVSTGDAPTTLRLVEEQEPALVVLDVNLGGWDGFDLLKEIRARSQLPVIMLTGRDAEDDKVRGLELGADDYVTKPFSYRELIARIRANLKHHGREGSPPEPSAALLRIGPIAMNVAQHTVTKADQPLKLTVTEFRLLHFLMTQAGNVVPTQSILKHVWGYDDPDASDVVRVTVHRLRRKLGEHPDRPYLLHTVPGVGVMFRAEAE